MIDTKRPIFPKKAVVTGGMPYGNKRLHLGHIGAVFIPADIYSRFLRDRIGKENVVFVSGTDCYGSPIVEYYKKAVADGSFSGSLEDFVLSNHKAQKNELDMYSISNNLFATSALGRSGEIHRELSAEVLKTLHKNGHLEKHVRPQFYDAKLKAFLNGRQVIGRCPIPGCKSEKAYADECELGHPYEPKDLIAPKSALSGEAPEMKDVTNWYINLASFADEFDKWITWLEKDPGTRSFITATIKEFLAKPTLYVRQEHEDELEALRPLLPPHRIKEDPSKAIPLEFNSLSECDRAGEILFEKNIRFRAGKTLTPFRLTGNIEWSIQAPTIDGVEGLTFWVWPESLWAPISFTKTYLESIGKDADEWKKYWCSKDALVYQFIGEDNIYFYSLAQEAIFMALQGEKPEAFPADGFLQATQLIANKHLLQGKKKASSSGDEKPIMAEDLLKYYTSDQLRAHFFALGLGLRSISFNPKPLNPDANPRESDAVLKEGMLLSNVTNRLARSCFYTSQKYFDGKLPEGSVSDAVKKACDTAILEYERLMYTHEFHAIMMLLDTFIRDASKFWASESKEATQKAEKKVGEHASIEEKMQAEADYMKSVLVDSFHYLRTIIALLHPIAPIGSQKVFEYLKLDESFWSWDTIFEPLHFFIDESHVFKFLEPRVDFFEKHETQVGK